MYFDDFTEFQRLKDRLNLLNPSKVLRNVQEEA